MLCTCDVGVSNLAARSVSSTLFFNPRHLSCPIPSCYIPTADRAVKIRCFLLHRQAASPESSSPPRAKRWNTVFGKLSLRANRRPAVWTQARQLDSWLHHFTILLTYSFIAIIALIISGISLVVWPVMFDIYNFRWGCSQISKWMLHVSENTGKRTKHWLVLNWNKSYLCHIAAHCYTWS